MIKITQNTIKKLMAFTLVFVMNVQAAELQVTIENINSNNGSILAQIFTGEENYKNGKAEKNQIIIAKKGSGLILFKDLKVGEYVVRMFHDENSNNKMDANAFGMPTEGYAFSNEAIGNMGPPKYKEMLVIITEKNDRVETKAKMIYL